MRTLEVGGSRAVVELTADELLIVNNAINEVCNGIDVPEFSTRIGSGREEALALLKEIGATLDRLVERPP
jgi:hypothetical protein